MDLVDKMITLISHFWNEEFLLPFWIKHHLPMFDHVVLIDYDSTDRSAEIIRDLAPHWEIRQSRNKIFEANAVDQEVMDIESEFRGWKVCLNTTEFLVHSDVRSFLRDFETRRPDALGLVTLGLIIADTEAEEHQAIRTEEPLVLQRTHGYIEHQYAPVKQCGRLRLGRYRLLHKAIHGHYHKGRHGTDLPNIVHRIDPGYKFSDILPEDVLHVAAFAYAPMAHIRPRKLAIQTRIPKDRIRHHHRITPQELQQQYEEARTKSIDLLTIPLYKKQLELCEYSSSDIL